MSAVLKSISFWAALAAVPVAATIARPRTNCRRLRAPFSNWLTRLEMIASMTTPFSSGGKLRLHIIEHAAVFAIEHAAVGSVLMLKTIRTLPSGFRALCLPCPEGQLDFGKPDLRN